MCDLYGTQYFYIPGTETCVNASTGETRRETENGTFYSQIELADRLDNLELRMADNLNYIAISNALQDPDLVAGERFGLKMNWGTAGSRHAFGLSGAIVVHEGFTGDGRGRVTGSGAVAFRKWPDWRAGGAAVQLVTRTSEFPPHPHGPALVGFIHQGKKRGDQHGQHHGDCKGEDHGFLQRQSV